MRKGDPLMDAVRDAVKPVFDRAVSIGNMGNSMTIPLDPPFPVFRVLWRPHNYRRAVRFFGVVPNSGGGTTPPFNYNSHSKIMTFRNFRGLTLQMGKTKLMALWKGERRFYLLEGSTQQELDSRIAARVGEMCSLLDAALYDLLERLGLKAEGLPYWVRHEDMIKGDDYLDKLPEEMVIHDSVFKKVYKRGAEFIGGLEKVGGAEAKAYIKNRVVESFAPEVASAIEGGFRKLSDEALIPLTEQIKLHLAVQRETLRTMKAIRNSLTEKEDRRVLRSERAKKLLKGWGW